MDSLDDILTQAYVRCRAPLRKWLARRLRNEADAEDLVQEAYARWAGSGAATRPHNPLAYLTRIALNALQEPAFRNARRERGHERLTEDAIDGALPPPYETNWPERDTENRQLLQRLQSAIAELPPRQRQAFTLHRFDGLSYAQIAAHMGISRRMVAKHIAHALAYCHLRVQYPSAEALLRHRLDP